MHEFKTAIPLPPMFIPLWVRPKLKPPGLLLGAIDTLFIIDEPTIHTVILSGCKDPVKHIS
jgi:hypothetical protein